MNIEKIRQDFPAIKDWTYLDTAFVGLFPRQVRAGYDEFLDQWLYFRAKRGKTILTEWLEKTDVVREIVASFIGAKTSEVAFTMCTGSGLNIVVNGTNWNKGDNVVFPEWEHNSLDTSILRRNGVESRPLKVSNGCIELSDLERVVDDRTRLVQISQVGYVNGFRFDLKEVADVVHKHGGKLLVDSTQALGAIVTDVKRENVDFVSAAPYKYLMGPAGLAFLYVNEESLCDLSPDRVGWKNQIWEGERAEKPSENPETASKFEYGTLHFQGVYGLEKSIEYIRNIGLVNIEKRVLELSAYLWKRLYEQGKNMYTPRGTKSPIVSFYEKGSVELSAKLMAMKIKVTGREAHGGHIRTSVHFYNNREDIDHFIECLNTLSKI